MTPRELDLLLAITSAAANYLASQDDQNAVQRCALYDALEAFAAAMEERSTVPASVSFTTTRYARPRASEEGCP